MKKNFAGKGKSSSPVQENKKALAIAPSPETSKQQLLQKKVDDLRALHKNITLSKVNAPKETLKTDNNLAEEFEEIAIDDGDQRIESRIVTRSNQHDST